MKRSWYRLLAGERRTNEPRGHEKGHAINRRPGDWGRGGRDSRAAFVRALLLLRAVGATPAAASRSSRMRLLLLGFVFCRRVAPAAVVAPTVSSPGQGPGPGTATGAVADGEVFAGGEAPAGEVACPAFSASSRTLYTSGRNRPSSLIGVVMIRARTCLR
jgi:hypothetical protein